MLTVTTEALPIISYNPGNVDNNALQKHPERIILLRLANESFNFDFSKKLQTSCEEEEVG